MCFAQMNELFWGGKRNEEAKGFARMGRGGGCVAKMTAVTVLKCALWRYEVTASANDGSHSLVPACRTKTKCQLDTFGKIRS